MKLRVAIPYIFVLGGSVFASATEPTAEGLAFFEKEIRPILSGSCYSCHSEATKVAGGLRVDDFHGLLDGGDSGAAIVPFQADESLLIQRITHSNPNRVMPQESDLLTPAQIEKLRHWINSGAPWPKESFSENLTTYPKSYEKLVAEHWAWQPVNRDLQVPNPRETRSAHEVDRFIAVKLAEKQLQPNAPADRATLLRRAFYDLTGLPPQPEDIHDFEHDETPDAYERWIDRLLNSSAFGEKWGRHWLDVARYGESTGPSRNIPYPHAWKYRDYVIDAVNRDVPYPRFLQEQIAGDLLESASAEERDRLHIATGFLALGVKDVNQRFKTRFVMDQVDEKIETVSRAVLGLTVSCARCHDHKFDPIPATDYYALAGIFTSTDDATGVRNKMGGGGLDYYHPEAMLLQTSGIIPTDETALALAEKQAAKATEAFEALRGTAEGRELLSNGRTRQRAARLRADAAQAALTALRDPKARGFGIHGVKEGSRIGDTAYRIRGEAERLGPTVPRGFLTLWSSEKTPIIPEDQSGRLQLVEWLVDENNPLTARVMVNRAWKHLFGEGLVKSVDNFGITGEQPSHPELLDFLATRFLEQGGSMKSLVKYLMLSETYQRSSDDAGLARNVDPSNTYLWKHTARRLSSEEVRDSMLSLSGELQHGHARGSAVAQLPMIEVRDNAEAAQSIHEAANQSKERSVYLPLMRTLTPLTLAAFDPVDQTLVTGRRDSTTVATQALFMMNSAFVLEQAKGVTQRLDLERAQDLPTAIQSIFWTLLSRSASPAELDEGVNFLTTFDSSSSGQATLAAWQALAQAVLASAEFRFVH